MKIELKRSIIYFALILGCSTNHNGSDIKKDKNEANNTKIYSSVAHLQPKFENFAGIFPKYALGNLNAQTEHTSQKEELKELPASNRRSHKNRKPNIYTSLISYDNNPPTEGVEEDTDFVYPVDKNKIDASATKNNAQDIIASLPTSESTKVASSIIPEQSGVAKPKFSLGTIATNATIPNIYFYNKELQSLKQKQNDNGYIESSKPTLPHSSAEKPAEAPDNSLKHKISKPFNWLSNLTRYITGAKNKSGEDEKNVEPEPQRINILVVVRVMQCMMCKAPDALLDWISVFA